MNRITLLILVALSLVPLAAPQNVHHVAGRTPVRGPSLELSAERPPVEGVQNTPLRVGQAPNPWKLQATLPGAIIHDISFPTRTVGYAAAELGQVWKTTNGGTSWTEILNLQFPYYWYGVTALTAKDVVISGFNDSNFEGIIRWSHDGGVTWTPDIVLTTNGWSYRTRFANAQDGLVMDGLDLSAPNAVHYTTDGGPGATDWTEVAPVDPNGGWFGNQFSLLRNLHARASGISFCASANAGQTWKCGPPIDSVFDGPTFFLNDQSGWVGGGEISPSVEGWVHRTTDGGKTWSGRTLDGPLPIREIHFLNSTTGWAAGGDVFTGVGGIYFSNDGGQTWSLDVNTGAEMDACDVKTSGTRFQIWCAGTNGAFNGVVYTLRGTAP
ncbi:MAG: hypothetical protein LAO03_04985 [Acidobacteriia bacterium]|nr:hypothetical protein [Terriglobia bacterium]